MIVTVVPVAPGTVIPESVRIAAEVYAAMCCNAILRLGKPDAEYKAETEALIVELANRIVAELADTENVRTNSETGEPYVILHPHYSSAVSAIMNMFGIRFIDMAPASVRVVVTETSYTLSVDTFGADRRYFAPDNAGE